MKPNSFQKLYRRGTRKLLKMGIVFARVWRGEAFGHTTVREVEAEEAAPWCRGQSLLCVVSSLVFHSTHLNVTLTLAQEQGVWRALHTCVIFMRSCCVLLDSLRLSLVLFAFHFLSHLPFHSPDHLHLPCGGQEPCALSRMRTLASLIENDPPTFHILIAKILTRPQIQPSPRL